MYTNAKELLDLVSSKGQRICDVVLENEAELMECSVDEVKEKMVEALKVMLESSKKGMEHELRSMSGLLGGQSKKLYEYNKSNRTLCGSTIVKLMARAVSCSEVNASMGKIVAAPTAGSCGIVPAVIITCAEILEQDEEKMLEGLFTASGIGQIIARNATLSGAEGGCQAECGSAAAMAAAAAVEMAGGTPEQAVTAANIALQNVMGLICDPVAGLVELPCANRNASGAVNAMICADNALAGITTLIPFDETVAAMYKVGKALPESLRETALGGIADTPTGQRLKREVLK